jgi:hypothetical protein
LQDPTSGLLGVFAGETLCGFLIAGDDGRQQDSV